MCDPILAKYSQRARRQRHVAILGPLAAVDMDRYPGCVDVADLQVQDLSESQAQRVNHLKVGHSDIAWTGARAARIDGNTGDSG